jgi:hypothetical protein
MPRRFSHVVATLVVAVAIVALYLFVFNRGQWP